MIQLRRSFVPLFPMKRWLTLLMLTLVSASPKLVAQEIDSISVDERPRSRRAEVKRRLDNYLDGRDQRAHVRVDTLYLMRPEQPIRLRAQIVTSGTKMAFVARPDGNDLRVDLSSRIKTALSLGAAYRGLSASISIRPLNLLGRNSDSELTLASYTNRYGVDLSLQSTRTYAGHAQLSGTTSVIEAGSLHHTSATLSGYYALNHRKFSIPAAFSQSWIQRRSAGSVLLGATATLGRIDRPGDVEGMRRIDYGYVSLGAGYGYNMVLRSGWLIHLSALPQLVLYSRGYLLGDLGARSFTDTPALELVSVGRLAVIRSFSRYFVGVSSHVLLARIGSPDGFQLSTERWRSRLFFGVRL